MQVSRRKKDSSGRTLRDDVSKNDFEIVCEQQWNDERQCA
jgi:hypothetical protein